MNVTPDSFSDGGNFFSVPAALDRIEQLLSDGADVVEVGGESTRPGTRPVSDGEEIDRILPVLSQAIQQHPSARFGVDTVKSKVARAALDAGATLVNDVSALRLDPQMAQVCGEARCTLVLMHSRGDVSDMARYDHAHYEGPVMQYVISELRDATERALAAGVDAKKIVLDPGVGFAKTSAQSLSALAHLPELADLGFPVMVGASRKRFIGEITGVQQAAERDLGSIGVHVAALALGATWFRVHDVRAHRQALDAAYAVLGARG